VVELCTETGDVMAKGLVNFSAWDLRVLLGRRSTGEKMSPLQEVVHRDAMVAWKGGQA